MGTLYVVGTPIGNLEDLSARAAHVLRSVDRVLVEDTRRTRTLMQHLGAETPLVSMHEHNEVHRTSAVLEWLAAGEGLALVSDAGMPLVSDPGQRLVGAVIDAGHEVVPVPGASAVLTVLVASGFAMDGFSFLGFVERKGKARQSSLERVARSREPVVLFESPKRLVALLDALADVCGPDRRVCVGREMTKLHEEFVRGSLLEVADHYRERAPRGEVALVVDSGPGEVDPEARTEEATAIARELLSAGVKPSEAARLVAGRTGLARNDAYRIVHALQDDSGSE